MPTDDFAGAKALYIAPQTYSTSLQDVANLAGMPAGLDAFILSALDGTGSFSAAGEESGRREACQKSTMNNMLSAFTVAKSATGDAADWKFAKTLYFGAATSQSS